MDANDSWKYTLDAIASNHWLFKVLELEMTLLQQVSLLILWIFKIYFLEEKAFVLCCEFKEPNLNSQVGHFWG